MIIRRIESRFEQRRRRVGAYARVSTGKEAQEDSFETQCRYYETFIRSNPRWDYVRVYADTGKSGTSAKKRVGFQQMLEDARRGKVDIIYCKSISRFARNVADAQRYTRELKGLGVEVRFEREVLSTFDSTADIVFNILAAVAQEESRSISENVKWSYRKNAEKGVRRLGNNRVLGYDVDKAGKLVPNKDAWIIEEIFGAYADGVSLNEIVQTLNRLGARRLRSKKPFTADAILRMLDNELYVGDRRIQREAPSHYLTKRPDTSAEFAQHYITDDHPAIVDRETWNLVRKRRENRRLESIAGIHPRAGSHFLYGLVFCAKCNAPYKRRTIKGHNGVVYKAWNCAERQKGPKGNGCRSPMIREAVLLESISNNLGWLWAGEEHFEVASFLETVERVEVGGGGVEVGVKGDFREPQKEAL